MSHVEDSERFRVWKALATALASEVHRTSESYFATLHQLRYKLGNIADLLQQIQVLRFTI